MKPRLSGILGIFILGRHAAAAPYSGTSNALSNATARIGQSQSLGTNPRVMVTQVNTAETVGELVPELGASTAGRSQLWTGLLSLYSLIPAQ